MDTAGNAIAATTTTTPVMDGRDGFVGIDEAAKFLGVSQATIRRMTSSNRLKCYRFSRMGHRRFRKSDLISAFQIRAEA